MLIILYCKRTTNKVLHCRKGYNIMCWSDNCLKKTSTTVLYRKSELKWMSLRAQSAKWGQSTPFSLTLLHITRMTWCLAILPVPFEAYDCLITAHTLLYSSHWFCSAFWAELYNIIVSTSRWWDLKFVKELTFMLLFMWAAPCINGYTVRNC
jgi:hypothetical protein